jgi:hypothetical protein
MSAIGMSASYSTSRQRSPPPAASGPFDHRLASAPKGPIRCSGPAMDPFVDQHFRGGRDRLRGLQERAVLGQRDQEPQLFQVQPGDDRMERWGSCLSCVKLIPRSHLLSCRARKQCNTAKTCGRPSLDGGHDKEAEPLTPVSITSPDVGPGRACADLQSKEENVRNLWKG